MLQAVGHRPDPPAVIVLPLRPEIAELRHDLLGEELRRMSGLFVRHVADVQEAEDVSDVEALDELLHLLAYGLRAARDHVTVLEEILPGESRELGEGVFGESG